MGSSMTKPIASTEATTLLDVLEKVPHLVMTIAARAVGRSQGHAGANPELLMLRLVSKRASMTVNPALTYCHLRCSNGRLEHIRKDAMWRISTLLTCSQLKHLRVTIHTTALGLIYVEPQLRGCLQALAPVLGFVTHLKLTTQVDLYQIQAMIAKLRRIILLITSFYFSRTETCDDIISCLLRRSSSPAALLAPACPNLTHLAVDYGVTTDSIKIFGKHCPHITSLQLLDGWNGPDNLQVSLTHLPCLTHVTITFGCWQQSRVEFLHALSSSSTITHLTLGADCMVSVEEWQALPTGLRELRFACSHLRPGSTWFDYVFIPPMTVRVVESMLGLTGGQSDTYNSNTSQFVMCTRMSSNDAWVFQQFCD